MANTVIQLKYSTVTATPASLNIAEPAYSYTSNIAYIGSPAGTGSIAIGGKFYIDQQGQIWDSANSSFIQANAAFASANAQAGVNLTQNTSITAAFSAANTAYIYANAAFAAANTAAAGSVDQSARNTANASFDKANSAYSNAGTAQTTADNAATAATNAQNSATAAYNQANTATNSAAAAFTTANNALPKSGGTITGSLVIDGNLTVSGTRTYANTTNVQLGDNIITLNAEIPSTLAPTENAGFEVNRGSSANVALLWNESSGKWTATNDGTYYYVLADAAVDATQNTNITSVTNTAAAAFLAGNTAATLQSAINSTQNTNITNAQNTADAAFLSGNNTISLQSAINLTQNNSITAAFEAANSIAGVNLTQNNSIAAVFSLANGTALIANTDVTNISIGSADYGSSSAVASFKVAANGRIISANTTTIALDASAISTGTLSVSRGGTGATSFTTNGVLLGAGGSALSTASSSTEGHVLTINNSGVPTFSHLSGGTF